MTLRVIDGNGVDTIRERIKQVLADVATVVESGEAGGALILLLHDDGYSAYGANVSEQEMVWVMERHKATLFKG